MMCLRLHRFFSCRLAALSLSAVTLSGCPLSDKYYIEQNAAGGSASTGSVGTGGASTGGVANSSSAGVGGDTSTSTAIGGAGGLGIGGSTETGGAGGATATSCDATTCTGTCCDSGCADLQTDAANCGLCGNPCPTGRSCRAGRCYGWTTMSAPPPELVPREKAAYVAMGTKLFIFGGLDADGNALNSGAIYDPATDAWTMLPQTTNVPSPRQLASAFWTGLRVFVIGGRDSASALAYTDVARFDPDVASWAWIATAGLPTGRVAPWGAAGSSYLMVWGGLSASDTALSGGERYAYTTYGTGSWSSIIAGYMGVTPDRVSDATWASTTSTAYLFGGKTNGTTKTNKAYYYGFASNSWTAITAGAGSSAPSARWGSFGTCDDSSFYVWGGRDDTKAMADGYRYATSWLDLGTTNAPMARWAPWRRTGWAFTLGTGDIAIIGGMDISGVPLIDGGRYNRATDTWSRIDAWPSQEAHEWGVSVLLNGEIFVWGGRNGVTLTTTGERWLP